jgi:hypothetical protein
MDYRLAYDAMITSLSSLTSVTVCGSSNFCFPATSFTATSGVNGTFNGGGAFLATSGPYPNNLNFGSPPQANYAPIVGDFNGDGKTDFAFSSWNGVNVFLSNGDGTFSESGFAYPSNAFTFLNCFAPSPVPIGAYCPLLVGDFNGDGKRISLWWAKARPTSSSATVTVPSYGVSPSTQLLRAPKTFFGGATCRSSR